MESFNKPKNKNLIEVLKQTLYISAQNANNYFLRKLSDAEIEHKIE